MRSDTCLVEQRCEAALCLCLVHGPIGAASNSAAERHSPSAATMPMLAPTCMERPSMTTGARIAASRRSATVGADRGCRAAPPGGP